MEGETRASHYLLLSAYFFASVAYSVVIPQSWHLAKSLLVDSAAWSGALIGSYYASSLLGMCVFYELRKAGYTYKVLFVYPCFGRVLSAIAFCMALQTPLALSPWLLLASRLTEGALNSCQFLCALQYLTIIAKDRVALSSFISLFANSGIGCGMLLSAAIEKGSYHTPDAVRSNLDFVQAALPIIFMGVFWAIFGIVSVAFVAQDDPIPQAETSALATRQLQVQSGSDLPDIRKSIMVAALFFNTVRGFVGSGIDSASILILETQWHWSAASAALAVGCCYLMSIVWHSIFTMCRYSGVKDDILVSSGLAICGVAALGMFNVAEGETNNVGLLLTADGIIFPVFMLTSGTVAAMASRACFPDDTSFFGLPWFLFLSKACTETLGLGQGPMVARSILDNLGRPYYASLQLFCIISVAVAWATIIKPGYSQLAHASKCASEYSSL